MDRWWQNFGDVGKEILCFLGERQCNSANWDCDTVKYSISGAVAHLKLDDTRTGNALTTKTLSALTDAVVELHGRPDVKVVVFTASGFYFCSGGAFAPGDSSSTAAAEAAGASQEELGIAANMPLACLVYLLNTMPQFKVASIRGQSMGAGNSIIASMDYVIAPEQRTSLSFKEATRGLAACTSWQGVISKIGVMQTRRCVLFAQDVTAAEALELGLIHELIPAGGPLASALRAADERAAEKSLELASGTESERLALKTTGPWGCRTRLLPVPAAVLDSRGPSKHGPLDFSSAVANIIASCGHKGRPSCARLSNEMWPHTNRVMLERAGQHVAVLRLLCQAPRCHFDRPLLNGLLDALVELHKSVGKVRLVCIHLESLPTCTGCFSDIGSDCPKEALDQALFLLQMLPFPVVGIVAGKMTGLGVLMCATFDQMLADKAATFAFAGLSSCSSLCADFLAPRLSEETLKQLVEEGPLKTATEMKALGLVSAVVALKSDLESVLERVCERVSSCAPNAVAQSKAFLHQVGTCTMDLSVLRSMSRHLARFADSIRAISEKDHRPAYNRHPHSRVIPPHMLASPAPVGLLVPSRTSTSLEGSSSGSVMI
ncbi:unnamed protein product [Polarella glacialis]|uniref:3-hydroxyisobutyryl-coenzyme A hydrolase n=1 Tax=Polarella glacialis TaxID=89957 RepID=A0A813E7K8_POLGL|nr:unnamed protein product [Polarella glacialis]